MPSSLFHRCTAEGFGTFWLVFGGCGSAVLAAGYPTLGIGFAGVALAFGLTRLPSDPRRLGRPGARQALPGERAAAVYRGAGGRWNPRSRRAPLHRLRQA